MNTPLHTREQMRKEQSRKTGPHTTDGKTRSSQNSTKHSLRANPNRLLPGETQEEYNAVQDIWAAEYDSESPGTARLIEFVVNGDRMVRLSNTVVTEAHIALAEAEADPKTDPDRLEWLHKDLQKKLRYKTDHERSFQRALRNIEQFGQRRVREANAARRLEFYEYQAAGALTLMFHKNGIDYEKVFAVLPGFNQNQPEAPNTEETPSS